MEIADLYQTIVTNILQTPNIKKIILFGSRARNDHEPRSDIDLAIDCPGTSTREWLDLIDRVENIATLLKIDLIRLDTAESELKTRILKEGVTLYEQN